MSRLNLESFRVHVVLASAASALFLILALGAVLFVPEALRLEGASADGPEGIEAARAILRFHARFWPVALASLIAAATASFILYRRMVGPLVRIGRAYASLAEGRVPAPLQIRARDYLQPQASELNQFLQELLARSERAAAALDEIEELTTRLDAGEIAVKPTAELRECAERVRVELMEPERRAES